MILMILGSRNLLLVGGCYFRITDDKPILEQVHEYQNLFAETLAEGIKICELLTR